MGTTVQTVVGCKPQTAGSILVDLDRRKLGEFYGKWSH